MLAGTELDAGNMGELIEKCFFWVGPKTLYTSIHYCAQMFLKDEMEISCDEAFRNTVNEFYEIFLESDRIAALVKSGACSMYDIREVFCSNIERLVSCGSSHTEVFCLCHASGTNGLCLFMCVE